MMNLNTKDTRCDVLMGKVGISMYMMFCDTSFVLFSVEKLFNSFEKRGVFQQDCGFFNRFEKNGETFFNKDTQGAFLLNNSVEYRGKTLFNKLFHRTSTSSLSK